MTDQQLLREYAERRSEPAFAELVRRHVDLIYSAALRMVCDSHLAEDVTQGAFVALARSAPRLTERVVLSGWLHRTAQNIAAQTVRTDVRRRAREEEAAAMNELLAGETDAAWEQIAPHLDAALGKLGEADRDALLLRYFERKSAQEMAQVLGVSDEAAQKRVSRAVERLREYLAKRGVTVGAGGLVVIISANAVQAGPLSIATITGASLAATGATASGTFATGGVAKVALVMATSIVIVVFGTAMLLKSGCQKPARNEEAHTNVPDLIPFVPAPAPPKAGLKGVVLLRGAPPAETTITFDSFCGRLHNGPVRTRHYVVGSNGALANVLVYVKAGAPVNFPVGLPPVLLDNTNCLFEPYVSAVLTNQLIVIRNSDPFLHNAHVISATNPSFNAALPVRNGNMTRSFSRPELFVTIKCDVHPWMYAYVGVLDHPWFAVTDANGEFQFPLALPPGTYTLAALHRKAGEVTQALVVAPGSTNPPAQFFLDAK